MLPTPPTSGTAPFSKGFRGARSLFCLAAILWLSGASAVDSVDDPPDFIITTESFRFPSLTSNEEPTESPEEVKPDLPPSAPASKEEEPAAVEPEPVLVAFPHNHKNFTPSQYLGDQDFPPYFNHLNSYQQQYKNYNEQKEFFSRKPIKFEENSVKNYYLPQGVDPAKGEEGEEEKRVDLRHRKPFPYAFDNEGATGSGYGGTGFGEVSIHEEPHHAYGVRGHQENFLPHHFLPYGYPREQKHYKNEILHRDHHDVKKDEKVGNPWKKVFGLLTALVPLGLFLATLTPNVISINSTATTKTSRQRSEESPSDRFRADVLELLARHGAESLKEAQCEDKIICELARKGDSTAANPIEKGFWYLANETPWEVAEKAGMNDLFKAIKAGTCDTYECHSLKKSGAKSGFAKKLIRKRKVAE